MRGLAVIPVLDRGLGNSAYLVGLGDGRALAVDPSRDLRALRAAADRHRLSVAYVAETHLHADFLSGARQLAAVRPAGVYAAGHVPGALAIPLRGAFATWLGWLVADPATPLVFVAGPGQDLDELVWQALKIGYERLAGLLDGGMAAWAAAGHPVRATPRVRPGQVDPAQVLDVRQANEYAAGHLPGPRHVELGALGERAGELTGAPVVTMCSRGERATTAASLLERAGNGEVAVLTAGAAAWAEATGRPIEVGS